MINLKDATTLALVEAQAKGYDKVELLKNNTDSFVFEPFNDVENEKIELVGLPLRIVVDKTLGKAAAIRTMKY